MQIIRDRDTGRSKGFGFVEMTDDAAAAKAIQQFNGKEVNGRALTVNEARAMERRDSGPRGSVGGGRDRGGRGGYEAQHTTSVPGMSINGLAIEQHRKHIQLALRPVPPSDGQSGSRYSIRSFFSASVRPDLKNLS